MNQRGGWTQKSSRMSANSSSTRRHGIRSRPCVSVQKRVAERVSIGTTAGNSIKISKDDAIPVVYLAAFILNTRLELNVDARAEQQQKTDHPDRMHLSRTDDDSSSAEHDTTRHETKRNATRATHAARLRTDSSALKRATYVRCQYDGSRSHDYYLLSWPISNAHDHDGARVVHISTIH